MKRFLVLLVIVAPTTGCMTLTPVGPLAGAFTSARPVAGSGASRAPIVTAPMDVAAMPPAQDAPPPPRPAFLVGPEDVNESTARDVERKLTSELDQDRRSARQIAPTSEVSTISRNGR